jgi:indoleacetamide hydrolase
VIAPLTATSFESATEILDRVANRVISVEDVVRDALNRCKDLHGLNALISIREDDAINEARAMEVSGVSAEALRGLPIIVKDNIALGGWRFTGGTPAFSDHIATTDASVVARLRAAGAIVVGKANLHEIAFGATSNNAWVGPVRNPHDHSRISGGSSGGSAAAVAAGMVTIALGTDTGGSGRIPAALCGCVGYRPTTGRYPSDGVMLLSTTRDTISLTARNVSDIIIVDEVITGHAHDEKVSAPDLCVGVLTPFADSGLSEDVRAAFEHAVNKLRQAGIKVVTVDGHELHQIDQEIGLPVVIAETYALWQSYARDILQISLSDFAKRLASPDVRAVFQHIASEAGQIPAAHYAHIVSERLPRLRQAYKELFAAAAVDVLIFPTVVTTAPLIGHDEEILIGDNVLPTFPTLIRNVGPGSLAGMPGVSVPIKRSAGELPIGLALDGQPGEDTRLLAIAAILERIVAE